VLGDLVRIEVEDLGLDDQARQPGLFLRFGQGHAREVALAIRVPAQLQPAIQLAMVREQHARPRAIDQPGRCRPTR
jgi:hypothetical protein